MATKTASEKYIEAVGRRKTATARARLTPSSSTKVTINGKELESYFPLEALRTTALEPFLKVSLPTPFMVSVRVTGGGITGQADATRHAISRALVAYNAELRDELKKHGFLKRDPRAKERRKYGLKKARKAPQWSKR